MRVPEIVADGGNRLRGSTTAAVSLEFLLLFLHFFCFWLSKGTLSLITALLPKEFMWNVWIEQGIILLVLLLLVNPVRLGVISWYCSLGGGFVPAREALIPLTGLRYIKTLCFGLTQSAAGFLVWVIPLLPAVLLSGFLDAMFRAGTAYGGSYAMLLALCLILGFCGVIFAIYLSMGLFFMPYLYGKGKTANPFRAVAVSWKLCNGQRLRLLQLWFCLIPYLLLCLLIAPIPFAAAKIRTILTAFASVCFNENGLEI